jgi:hypothetical protein
MGAKYETKKAPEFPAPFFFQRDEIYIAACSSATKTMP